MPRRQKMKTTYIGGKGIFKFFNTRTGESTFGFYLTNLTTSGKRSKVRTKITRGKK